MTDAIWWIENGDFMIKLLTDRTINAFRGFSPSEEDPTVIGFSGEDIPNIVKDHPEWVLEQKHG